MKTKITALFTLLLLGLLLSPLHAVGGKRIALVIGNGGYRDAPLHNPVHDARLVAGTLRNLGFDVQEHFDADQKTMKRAIQRFGDQLEAGGRDAVGLFYYAGHGIQTNGVNYLIPVNAVIERERDVEIEAVSASAVMTTIDYARNRLNFVVLDACRNNPFARSFRSALRGLARMDTPRGTLVAYATAPGDVALDGSDGNSPYTAALVRGMQRPEMPVEQMFKLVRREVMSETKNRQVPWESSSLTGDFYFKAGAGEDTPTAKAPIALSEIDKEALFWQSIKESDNIEDYAEYLRQFPDGTFARLSHNRISALTDHKETEVVSSPKVKIPPPATAVAPAPAMVRPAAPPGSMRQVTEQEGNNRYGEAESVAPSGRIIGGITPRGDVDWYRLSVRRQGELQLHASNIAPNIDLVFRLWNSDKQAISPWITPLSKGGETDGVVDLKTAGNYFFEVHDSHDDESSQQPYHLDLRFTPSHDAKEPNDSYGTAATVTPGQVWKATILPKGDVDWYRFRVKRHGELKVDVSGVPQDLDILLRLWNSDKQAISNWFAPLKAGGETHAAVDLPGPGLYLLEMADSHNDGRSVDPFNIALKFTPSADRFEDNNSFGKATLLAVGETIEATVLPKGDSDWYRVEMDEQGALDIEVTGVPENIDISFRLWNSDKQAITHWFAPLKAGGETRGTIDIKHAGSYVLEMRDGRDDARSIRPYSVRLAFAPSQDRAEPNDSFGNASPLKLGTPIRGTILPKGDSDWYRISTHRAGELKIELSESPSNLDLVVRVWNADKAVISGWLKPLSAGGDTAGRVALPAAGNYVLEVRDGGDNGRSPTPYKLLVGI